MNWKKGKAGKEWTCVLCGNPILRGVYFLRPHHILGPSWSSEIVKGRNVRIKQRPPCFHVDCFETLGNWFGSTPPAFDNIYDNEGGAKLPLQDPKLHFPNGEPL